MPTIKHEWLRGMARSFGMSVDEFAKCIGYTRQRLYQAEKGGSPLRTGHLLLACHKLVTLNQELRERALQKAEDEYHDRRKMIMELQERLGRKGGANG